MKLAIKKSIDTSLLTNESSQNLSIALRAKNIILLRLLNIVRKRIIAMQQTEQNIIRALNEL